MSLQTISTFEKANCYFVNIPTMICHLLFEMSFFTFIVSGKHSGEVGIVTNLVAAVVANDALVFGEAQLTALVCSQSERREEARPLGVLWSILIGH